MPAEIVVERNIAMPSKVKGEGRPIVLVPDGLAGQESWDPGFERLSGSRKAVSVQLISVDRGARKEPLPGGYSVGMESAALRNTLDGLGLRRPLDIAAWSYGAEIALDFALDDPERVRTLTLIEPPAFWVLGGKAPRDLAYESLKALAGEIGGSAVTEQQLERFVCAIGLCPPDRSPRDLPGWRSWSAHRSSLLNTRALLGHCDDVERLHGFERPVLLVKGENSAPFLHRIADALAFELPHAELLLLPSGHAPHLVSPEIFLDRMLAFQDAAGV